MSAEHQHYSVWFMLFRGCPERPSSRLAYRIWAVFHLAIAYPVVVFPAFYDVFIQKQIVGGYEQFTNQVTNIWACLHVVLFVSVLLLVWGTRQSQLKEWEERLPSIMTITIVCDLVSTLLFATLFGFLNAAPHFVIFMVLIISRIFYPYRVALVAWLSTLATVLTLTSIFWIWPELAGVVPEKNAYSGTPREAVMHTGLLLVTLISALFCSVNFIVNQRNILQQYLTEQVLNRYLPPKLVEEAERGLLSFDHEPERKVLTVMFADLVGFTALSQKLGADGVGKVINRYLGELSEIAHYHGGTIDKFVGDCIMVFFGAPDSMTPAAQAYRCVEMGRRIHERVAEIDWGHPLDVRVGIATGEVVVGHFGSTVRSDYTVIGPSVNLAARLESQCRPGSILMSRSTAELIGDAMPLVRVGPMILKGVGDDVYAFELKEF